MLHLLFIYLLPRSVPVTYVPCSSIETASWTFPTLLKSQIKYETFSGHINIHQLVRSLVFTNSSAWQRSLFGTMFLVAFYGLFRLGELVTKSTHLGSSVVQYHSLTCLTCNANGLPHTAKISISEYKHNPSKRPFHILIAREDSPSLCPVTALLEYTRPRGDRPDPLFCNADFSSVSFHQFNTELQRCLIYCGLDIRRFKSHSFRIGGACHAADKGFSDAQIRALGRWKSDAFKVYLRSEIITAN